MSDTRAPLLERFGLHRPALRAWAMYDWANSAFILVVITAVFPIYYQTVAAAELEPEKATSYFGMATTLALVLVAVLSPLLGAMADFLGRRKQMMAIFVALGVLASAGLGLVGRGDWELALVLFALGNIGVATSFVFYNALLSHVAHSDELDRVSTAGYALGYFGSGMLLIVNLLWIQKPEWFGLADGGTGTRLAFFSVAVWWALFSIPLFRRVPEPPREIEADEARRSNPAIVTLRRLKETFHELRGGYKEAFKLLIAVLVYNDGIGTVIRMAAIYATSIAVPQQHIIGAILVVQFVGVPFAFLFGNVASRIGAKRAVFIAVMVYMGICVLAYRLESVVDFYIMAFCVGAVQGGAQALSRSLFASMIPKHKAAEFFGFFAVFDRFSGILGTALFTAITAWPGSSQKAILSVMIFFIVGGALLTRVDVAAGRRHAREADESLTAAG